MNFHSSDQITAKYTGLIMSWLYKMIRHDLAPDIDIEQLATTIVFELICYLDKTSAGCFDEDGLIRICRTITNRKVADEIRFHRRQIRLASAQNYAQLDLNIVPGCADTSRPEHQIELDDFISVFLASLDVTHRELVERKLLGWTNDELATEFRVSIRTIQSRIHTIERALRAALRRSDHPSPITHHRKCSSFCDRKGILNFFFDSPSRSRLFVDLDITPWLVSPN